MKNLIHAKIVIYNDQVVFKDTEIVKENISDEEIIEMKNDGLIADRNDLNKDLVYHTYSISSFVVVDQETGEQVVLDRYITQLSNDIIKAVLTKIH